LQDAVNQVDFLEILKLDWAFVADQIEDTAYEPEELMDCAEYL
jgi:hypothetical protein